MFETPVTVVVVTKNEARNIARCLRSASDFDDILVVDSGSSDGTAEIARQFSARVLDFSWNGLYPKKRQWILENIQGLQDWILWLDADEELTPALSAEIQGVLSQDADKAGYFIRGCYVWNNRRLRYGMMNNKIALMNRHKMEFPIVDDIEIEGMGEIEGHYQPVIRGATLQAKIGQLKNALMHHAYENEEAWTRRHMRYARWEAEMTLQNAWPEDPLLWRDILKNILRRSALRPWCILFYSFILKQGFFDGWSGWKFAISRKKYCDMVLRELGK